jgi:hypothetical protein
MYGGGKGGGKGGAGKLFVGGLAWTTGDQGLYDAFGKIGEVADAKVRKLVLMPTPRSLDR